MSTSTVPVSESALDTRILWSGEWISILPILWSCAPLNFEQMSSKILQGMLFSMVYTRSTVVRVPELTNAVIAGLVASCAPAAVMPLSVSPLVGPGTDGDRGPGLVRRCKKNQEEK